MLMNAIEENDKDVLHTLLVSELRSVYNIKYQKDSAKQGKTKNNVRMSIWLVTLTPSRP